MNGDYTLSVVTPSGSHALTCVLLRDTDSRVLYMASGISLNELYRKARIQNNEGDFFVIINHICREYGLRFVSHREKVLTASRVRHAFLEKRA